MSKINARGLGRRSGRLSNSPLKDAPRKPSTKDLLIEAAEMLFGRHGFDGISLREIAAAAGQANYNAVQYHFKDKSGLIGAILDKRMQQTEALRCEKLELLKASKRSDLGDLLTIMWLPLMSVRGADGSHTFCRFLLQHMLQPNFAEQPLARFRAASRETLASPEEDLSCLEEVEHLLRQICDNVPYTVYSRRLTTLSMMFLASVVEHDNACQLGKTDDSGKFDLKPVLDMSIGALMAPD